MPRTAPATPIAFLNDLRRVVAELPEDVRHPQKLWFNVENPSAGGGAQRVETAVIDGDYTQVVTNAVAASNDIEGSALGLDSVMDCAGRCIGVRGADVMCQLFSEEQLGLTASMSRMAAASMNPMMEQMLEFGLFNPYDSANVHALEADSEFRRLVEKTVRKMLPLLVHHMAPEELEAFGSEEELVDDVVGRFKPTITWRQPDVLPPVAHKSWVVDIGISGWFAEFTEFSEAEEDAEAFLPEQNVHLPLLPEMRKYLNANRVTMTDAMLDTALSGAPWRQWTPVDRGDSSMETFHFYKTLVDAALA